MEEFRFKNEDSKTNDNIINRLNSDNSLENNSKDTNGYIKNISNPPRKILSVEDFKKIQPETKIKTLEKSISEKNISIDEDLNKSTKNIVDIFRKSKNLSNSDNSIKNSVEIIDNI